MFRPAVGSINQRKSRSTYLPNGFPLKYGGANET
jgi:hypothetical protein